MKASLPLLHVVFGSAVCQSINATDTTQPDLSGLASHFENLTDSFLSKALKTIDERADCAKVKGEEPTCTRENAVLRKE